MTKAKLAVMTREEAEEVEKMLVDLPMYALENPFNPPYWVVLINTPTGIRCMTSVLQAEWFVEGHKATKRALR